MIAILSIIEKADLKLYRRVLSCIPFLLLGAGAIIIFFTLMEGYDRKMYWDGDHAMFLLDMFHASKLEQTVGIASRFGWAHPGPINYYLLLPWYYFSGGGEQILMAATFAYNIFF
ncbi:hypothetical protein D3C77_192930 [compost metagenome]